MQAGSRANDGNPRSVAEVEIKKPLAAKKIGTPRKASTFDRHRGSETPLCRQGVNSYQLRGSKNSQRIKVVDFEAIIHMRTWVPGSFPLLRIAVKGMTFPWSLLSALDDCCNAAVYVVNWCRLMGIPVERQGRKASGLRTLESMAAGFLVGRTSPRHTLVMSGASSP